jgi:hypothetical protein
MGLTLNQITYRFGMEAITETKIPKYAANYPGISLPDAIERIKKIHARRTPTRWMQRQWRRLGYGGLNGLP